MELRLTSFYLAEKFTRNIRATILVASAAALVTNSAQAATSTWQPTSGTDWGTTGNWNGGTPVSTSTALFNTSGSVSVTNTAANQFTSAITFDTNAGSYTIGSTGTDNITLSSGGTTQIAATIAGTGLTETINAPLLLGSAGNSGTTTQAYTFSNNSADSTNKLVFGGPISVAGTSTGTTTLTLSGTNTGANSIGGALTNGSNGTLGLIKTGAGTWTLSSNSNAYTGSTVVNAGTLLVTGTLANTALTVDGGGTLEIGNGTTSGTLSSSSTLTLGASGAPGGAGTSGTFEVLGRSTGAATSVSIGALTLNPGSSAIVVNSNGNANSTTLALTTITHAAGGTVDFTLPAVGNITTTATLNGAGGTVGIFGGYATVGGTAWASKSGSNIVPLTTFDNTIGGSGVTTDTTTTHNDIINATGTTTLTGTFQPNSLVFNTTGTLANAGNNITFQAKNGLLVTASGGTISGSGIVGSGTGNEFIVNTAPSDTLNIQSQIISATTGSLTKAGTGTLNLSYANTYTGATQITAGTLNLAGSGGLAGTSVTVDGSTAAFTEASGATFTGSGSLTLLNGSATLNGTNSFSGGTTFTNGTLTVGNVAGLGGAGAAITVGNFNSGSLDLATDSSVNAYNLSLGGSTLTIVSDRATAGAGITQGLGTLSINTGTLIFTAGGIDTGSTAAVSFGATTLVSTSGGNATFDPTTANVTLASVTTSASSGHSDTIVLDGTTSGNAITGTIADAVGAGTVTVSKTNTSTWTLSGANTYTGTTTVGQGTLILGNAGAASTGTITVGSAVTGNVSLLTNGAYTIANSIAEVSGLTNALVSIGGNQGSGKSVYSGTLGLKKDTTLTSASGGEVDFTNTIGSTAGFNVTIDGGGLIVLTGTNTFTTGSGKSITIQNSSTLNVTANNNLGGASNALVINNGTLQFGGVFDPTSRTITFGSGGATFDTNGNNITFGADPGNGGAGGMTKTGSGTLTLSPSNNTAYSGTTTVNGGTLALGVGSTSAIGKTDALTVNGTGTLSMGAASAIVGAVILDGSGSITGSTGILSATSYDVRSGSASAILAGTTGGVTLVKSTAGTVTLSGANTFTGGVTIGNGTLSVATLGSVGAAQPLGENGTITFTGASLLAPGVLNYTSSSAGTLNQALSVTTGDFGTVSNTGGNVLTIAGTVSKSGSVLSLSGGKIVVSNVISGVLPSSDLDVVGGATVGLAAANTYTGPTKIYGNSSLLTGINAALPSNTDLTLGDASDATATQTTNTLDLLGKSQTVNSINNTNVTGANNSVNQIISGNGVASSATVSTAASSSTGTLTVAYSGGSTDAFSGSLGGANGYNNFSLVKSGTGILALTGANTYTGGTFVQNGTLQVGTGGSLASTTAVTLGSSSGNTSGVFTLGDSSGPVNQTVSSLATSGAGSSNAVVGGNGSVSTLTVNNSTADTYSGVLGGSGSNLNKVALNKTGAGALTLTSDSTYSGGSTITGGTLYVNNGGGASYTEPITNPHAGITATNTGGSGTGTGSVTVGDGVTAHSGTLAGSGTIATSGGVTVKFGGTLASGANQANAAVVNGGSGSVSGAGLTLNNTSLTVNGGATLAFDLGSSTTYSGGSGPLNFANPNTNSTYMSLTSGTVDHIFSNTVTADTINLYDLTNSASPGGVSLTLRAQNPYLLIQTALGDNSDFSNLWTTGGEGANGFVLGVSTGSGNAYTAFNLAAYDINGNLISSTTNLEGLKLYLYNGDLEVVPEPGTWALILAGFAALVGYQKIRRRNQDDFK